MQIIENDVYYMAFCKEKQSLAHCLGVMFYRKRLFWSMTKEELRQIVFITSKFVVLRYIVKVEYGKCR